MSNNEKEKVNEKAADSKSQNNKNIAVLSDPVNDNTGNDDFEDYFPSPDTRTDEEKKFCGDIIYMMRKCIEELEGGSETFPHCENFLKKYKLSTKYMAYDEGVFERTIGDWIINRGFISEKFMDRLFKCNLAKGFRIFLVEQMIWKMSNAKEIPVMIYAVGRLDVNAFVKWTSSFKTSMMYALVGCNLCLPDKFILSIAKIFKKNNFDFKKKIQYKGHDGKIETLRSVEELMKQSYLNVWEQIQNYDPSAALKK